jgi:nucleotide-binding universal stress UspA family protein
MNTVSERPVVVGLDRSPQAFAALEYAATLAARRKAPLRVVHAYEPSQFTVRSTVGWTPDLTGVLRNVAERLVSDALDVVRTCYPEVEVSARLEPGSAVEMLLAECDGAQAVVVGSRGSGGFADMLVGSTTLHVAAHGHGVVVAVPTPVEGRAPGRGVVVGVDGSAVSEPAIGYAFEAAADSGEPLTAVHVWYDVARDGSGRILPLSRSPQPSEEDRLLLAESMAGWREKFPDVEVVHKVVHGHPVSVLVDESRDAALLVVGCRGRGALRRLLLGSVSHGVLHHATVPVAVVHGADHGRS